AAVAGGGEDDEREQSRRDRDAGDPSPAHSTLPFPLTSRSSSPMYAAMTAGSERTSSGAPLLITSPSFSTEIESQSRMISLRSCSTTRIPHFRSDRICSIDARSPSDSPSFIPAAGSSSKR